MKKLAMTLLLVGGAAACGGDDAVTITMTKSDPNTAALAPDLLAYREGDTAAWTELPAGKLSFSVTGHDYEVAMSCTHTFAGLGVDGEDLVRHYSFRYLRTVDDPHTFFLGCDGNQTTTTPQPTQSEVTGTMVQAGNLDIASDTDGSDEVSSEDPNWAIDVFVPTSSTFLFAFDSTFEHALLRRDLVATAATTDLGTLDVVASGTALDTATFQLANVAQTEMTTSQMFWDFGKVLTFGDYTTSATPETAHLHVLPDSMLADGEHQDFSVTVAPIEPGTTATTSRGVEVDARSSSRTIYTLPDPIVGAAFSGTKVSWTTVPDGLEEITLYSTTPLFADLSAAVYVYATDTSLAGLTSLDLDVSDFPHFDASWTPDPAKTFTSFYAAHYLDAKNYDDVYVSASPVETSQKRRGHRSHVRTPSGARAK